MAEIVVHEPTSLWTAELERAFLRRPEVTIRWSPHRIDLLADVRRRALTILVIPPDDASLDLIRSLRDSSRSEALCCLVSSVGNHWEWLAREMGVDVILPDVVERGRLIASVTRFLSVCKSHR